MTCIYGKPKKKKTSDALAAFPRALFIGVPSAITLVAQNELGFTPAVFPQPPTTLDAVVELLQQLDRQGAAEQYGAIVCDDLSHICKQSMLEWEVNAPKGRSGKSDRFYPYQQLNKRLLQLSALSRHLGCHLVTIFHERPPSSTNEGVFCPGGPDVPSRKQVETVPSWCDINLRAIIDPEYPDPWFPGAYYCDPSDPEWVTGDRTGVCKGRTPGNLREILRASHSDYRLDRLPDFDWQDDVADEMAEYVVKGADIRESVVTLAAVHAAYPPLHVRWALQDGIARGVLQLRHSRGLFDFEPVINPSSENPLLPPPPA